MPRDAESFQKQPSGQWPWAEGSDRTGPHGHQTSEAVLSGPGALAWLECVSTALFGTPGTRVGRNEKGRTSPDEQSFSPEFLKVEILCMFALFSVYGIDINDAPRKVCSKSLQHVHREMITSVADTRHLV